MRKLSQIVSNNTYLSQKVGQYRSLISGRRGSARITRDMYKDEMARVNEIVSIFENIGAPFSKKEIRQYLGQTAKKIAKVREEYAIRTESNRRDNAEHATSMEKQAIIEKLDQQGHLEPTIRDILQLSHDETVTDKMIQKFQGKRDEYLGEHKFKTTDKKKINRTVASRLDKYAEKILTDLDKLKTGKRGQPLFAMPFDSIERYHPNAEQGLSGMHKEPIVVSEAFNIFRECVSAASTALNNPLLETPYLDNATSSDKKRMLIESIQQIREYLASCRKINAGATYVDNSDKKKHTKIIDSVEQRLMKMELSFSATGLCQREKEVLRTQQMLKVDQWRQAIEQKQQVEETPTPKTRRKSRSSKERKYSLSSTNQGKSKDERRASLIEKSDILMQVQQGGINNNGGTRYINGSSKRSNLDIQKEIRKRGEFTRELASELSQREGSSIEYNIFISNKLLDHGNKAIDELGDIIRALPSEADITPRFFPNVAKQSCQHNKITVPAKELLRQYDDALHATAVVVKKDGAMQDKYVNIITNSPGQMTLTEATDKLREYLSNCREMLAESAEQMDRKTYKAFNKSLDKIEKNLWRAEKAYEQSELHQVECEAVQEKQSELMQTWQAEVSAHTSKHSQSAAPLDRDSELDSEPSRLRMG